MIEPELIQNKNEQEDFIQANHKHSSPYSGRSLVTLHVAMLHWILIHSGLANTQQLFYPTLEKSAHTFSSQRVWKAAEYNGKSDLVLSLENEIRLSAAIWASPLPSL